jgi:hypothetical protein
MKKILKISLVLLTSLSFGLSAFAGEMTVTGTAKATYNIQSNDSTAGNDKGKGLGVANELDFTASGELDNGWTWTYQVQLDPGAVTTGSTNTVDNDDSSLKIGTPYGTVGICVSECGLNKQLAYSAAAYTAGIDLGVGAVIDPIDAGGWNNLTYATPAGLIPFGTTFAVSYAPSADKGYNSSNAAGVAATQVNTYADTIAGASDTASSGNTDFSPDAVKSVTEYAVTTSPIDGLTVNASYVDAPSSYGDAKFQSYEAGALNATYAYGPIKVGYGKVLIAPAVDRTKRSTTESVSYVENVDMSIGYAVNDNLSLSYEKSTSEANMKSRALDGVTVKSKNSQDVTSIQAAYTMGGMTLAVSQVQTDGDGYTKEETGTSRIDVKETIFAVTLAF